MKFSWKIGGEAGFGIMTTGLVFSKIASRLGYYIFDYINYPSLIRGGHNTYEVCVSSEPVSDLKHNVDVLVCLNQETFEKNKLFITKDSLVIYDGHDFEIGEPLNKFSVPFYMILKELGGDQIMKNTVALGASLALMGADLSELNEIISEQFAKKGQDVVDFNRQFAKKGFDFILSNYSSQIKDWLKKIPNKETKLVMTGSDAFSLAATIADCRLYVAYPMTPSSGPLATLAAWQNKTNMIVRHAEDEISVINTALGGSFAGARSAVGTSGGGFALMTEAVSLAGMTETPLVIYLAQRPGPATGMPTWTEQGDLLFAVNAGHGEFPKIVLAPGDLQEMIELTAKAFDLADIYQLPVIVMSDMSLSENHKTITQAFVTKFIQEYQVKRGKIFNKKDDYLRYQLSDDGISPRIIPGEKGVFYQANSYEHLEDGHTTEDAVIRKKQVDKRNKKTVTYLNKDFVGPKIYGEVDSAEIILVGWGSMKGPILEAQKILREKNMKTCFMHFTHIFPLDEKIIQPLFNKQKKYLLIENNSQAQFGKLLRQETGICLKEKLLKYDGRPIWPEEIVNQIICQQ